jgi:hypothetical protein
VTSNQPTPASKADFITQDSVDSLVLERNPEFLDYLFFHNVLDKFCFVLKAHYSDRERVKRKRYRLDLLLQEYIRANKISVGAKRDLLKDPDLASRLEFNLTKGWHNELVRSDPLSAEYLKVGVQLGGTSPGSDGLAAWNTIQRYYAFFEYYSAIAQSVLPGLKIDGHKKLSRNFNSQVAGVVSKDLLFYPFTLNSKSKSTTIPVHPKHCVFHYASYPRDPGRSIDDLDLELVKAFQLIGKREHASLLDVLYEFRLWANYTGVRSILKLTDGGYLGFLMKNLGTLVFFAGALAEIAVIRTLGEVRYLGILRAFQRDYVNKNDRFARITFLIPMYIRLRCYKHVGLISSRIGFIIPELEDPIQFIT